MACPGGGAALFVEPSRRVEPETRSPWGRRSPLATGSSELKDKVHRIPVGGGVNDAAAGTTLIVGGTCAIAGGWREACPMVMDRPSNRTRARSPRRPGL